MPIRQLIAGCVLASGLLANARALEPVRLPSIDVAPAEVPEARETIDAVETHLPSDWIVPASWIATSADPVAVDNIPSFELGVQFDKGIFIRSTDLESNPYSLYIGGRLQLRYLNFSPDELTWTDNSGTTRPILRRNHFDTERARINISGHAISPYLTYLFIIDGDGDDAGAADFLIYQFEYQFSDTTKLRLGRNKVASGREWLLSSRYLTLADRSMATEFFRPSFSDGIWIIGEPTETTYYELSLTNGLRTSRRRSTDLDRHLAVAATGTWEPLAPYGLGTTDFECHDRHSVRFGSSILWDESSSRADRGFPLGDDDFLRLSDGTRLGDVGALAPGVQVLGDTVYQLSLDAGWKYRGWSLSGEYFMRWLQDFAADGPLPVSKLYTYGFVTEAGYFWIPGRFDSNVRMSQVSGLFGSGFEYSTGCNWYWGAKGDQVNKITIDLSHIVSSPVNSSLADILVGDDGILLRTQVQIGF